MLESFLNIVLALLVVGVMACLLARSILPLLVVAAVIWTLWHFFDGFSGGGRG
jgi:hypothetical protein